MALEQASQENLEQLIKGIKKRLQVVNDAAFDASDFLLEDYGEIYDLYQMVHKKERLSMMELEGVLEELGTLRKKPPHS